MGVGHRSIIRGKDILKPFEGTAENEEIRRRKRLKFWMTLKQKDVG